MCGSSRLTNRVNVGGSVAPCRAYSTFSTVARRLALLGIGDDPVDVAGGHPAVVLLDRFLQHRAQLVHALAGERRDLQDRRVTDEVELAVHLGLDLERACSASSMSSHLLSITTIGQPDGVDAFGEALVLAGDTLGGVDHQQGDVGAVDRAAAHAPCE